MISKAPRKGSKHVRLDDKDKFPYVLAYMRVCIRDHGHVLARKILGQSSDTCSGKLTNFSASYCNQLEITLATEVMVYL